MTCLSGILWTQIDCHIWNSLLKHVHLSAGGSDLPGPIVLFCVAKYENFTAASVRKSLFSPYCLLLSTAWLPWTYLSTAPPSQFISLPKIQFKFTCSRGKLFPSEAELEWFSPCPWQQQRGCGCIPPRLASGGLRGMGWNSRYYLCMLINCNDGKVSCFAALSLYIRTCSPLNNLYVLKPIRIAVVLFRPNL